MNWILVLIFCWATLCFSEDHAIMSIYAVQSETGEVLMDRSSDLSLMPASCMKIVTTAAALHLLGESYRFETHLEYDGVIDQNKTLCGNLYIRGGGDPCLGSGSASDSLPWEKQTDCCERICHSRGHSRSRCLLCYFTHQTTREKRYFHF